MALLPCWVPSKGSRKRHLTLVFLLFQATLSCFQDFGWRAHDSSSQPWFVNPWGRSLETTLKLLLCLALGSNGNLAQCVQSNFGGHP